MQSVKAKINFQCGPVKKNAGDMVNSQEFTFVCGHLSEEQKKEFFEIIELKISEISIDHAKGENLEMVEKKKRKKAAN